MKKLLYPEISYKLQGCFYAVYNTLGFGHKEVIYQKALEEELNIKEINFSKEKKLPVVYHNKNIAFYKPDFLIENKIIVEIKALEYFPAKYITQLIYYLKGTNFQLGYLVNFGNSKLEIFRRIWTPKS